MRSDDRPYLVERRRPRDEALASAIEPLGFVRDDDYLPDGTASHFVGPRGSGLAVTYVGFQQLRLWAGRGGRVRYTGFRFSAGREAAVLERLAAAIAKEVSR